VIKKNLTNSKNILELKFYIGNELVKKTHRLKLLSENDILKVFLKSKKKKTLIKANIAPCLWNKEILLTYFDIQLVEKWNEF